MDLVLVSEKPIAELEKLVTDLFSAVENKDVKVPDLGLPVHPFKKEQLGKLTKYNPVKD